MRFSRTLFPIGLALLSLGTASFAQAPADEQVPLAVLTVQDHSRLLSAAVEHAGAIQKILEKTKYTADAQPQPTEVLRAMQRVSKIDAATRRRIDEVWPVVSGYQRFEFELSDKDWALVREIAAKVRQTRGTPERIRLLESLKEQHARQVPVMMALAVAADLLKSDPKMLEAGSPPAGKDLGVEIVLGAVVGGLWGASRVQTEFISRVAVHAKDGALYGATARSVLGAVLPAGQSPVASSR
jgi:hypothetical protein